MKKRIAHTIAALLCATVVISAFSDDGHSANKNQDKLAEMFKRGDIKVSPVLKSDLSGLKESHYLSMVVVELAPDNTEPAHTHPGEEILFGLSGNGAVYLDGVKHDIAPGTVIHVKEGQKKALGNTGSETFKVLAYLVLKKDKPVLTVSE